MSKIHQLLDFMLENETTMSFL